VVTARRPSRQDGFLREILWFTLIIVVAAIVVLDAVSLYSAYEKADEDATDAAADARRAYVQEQDVGAAKRAATELLEERGTTFVSFDVDRGLDEGIIFVVATERHADTYGFKYLRHVPGMADWVEDTENPSATGRSD
jgi:hypothetical protein